MKSMMEKLIKMNKELEETRFQNKNNTLRLDKKMSYKTVNRIVRISTISNSIRNRMSISKGQIKNLHIYLQSMSFFCNMN